MMRFIENIKSWAYLTPFYDWFGKRSYAQSGEDVIAWGELFGRTQGSAPTGFYVEVGAYHPKLFSNTYLFYKKGWRGICIEPNPRMEKLFRIARPRDVFLNYGVGDVGGVIRSRHSELDSESRKSWIPGLARNDNTGEKCKAMEYFEFEDSAANTFSVEQARKNQEEAGRKLIGRRRVPVLPLKTILDRYLPKGQKIDLLSVDAEGMDLEVLRSNDWKRYRPEMIIAEDLVPAFAKGFCEAKVVRFLDSVGYRLVAKTPYSVIFRVVE